MSRKAPAHCRLRANVLLLEGNFVANFGECVGVVVGRCFAAVVDDGYLLCRDGCGDFFRARDETNVLFDAVFARGAVHLRVGGYHQCIKIVVVGFCGGAEGEQSKGCREEQFFHNILRVRGFRV